MGYLVSVQIRTAKTTIPLVVISRREITAQQLGGVLRKVKSSDIRQAMEWLYDEEMKHMPSFFERTEVESISHHGKESNGFLTVEGTPIPGNYAEPKNRCRLFFTITPIAVVTV